MIWRKESSWSSSLMNGLHWPLLQSGYVLLSQHRPFVYDDASSRSPTTGRYDGMDANRSSRPTTWTKRCFAVPPESSLFREGACRHFLDVSSKDPLVSLQPTDGKPKVATPSRNLLHPVFVAASIRPRVAALVPICVSSYDYVGLTGVKQALSAEGCETIRIDN